MIGAPIEIGRVSEVLPVAPRAGVWAPLLMERLHQGILHIFLKEQIAEIVELARGFPPAWQRLVSAEFNNVESHLIYERFVGVTLRDISVCLRGAGRVLPVDVLRAVIEQVCDGLSALPTGPRGVLLSDRSIGLSIEGRWRFASGALNHWLINLATNEHGVDLEDPTLSADTVFLMSPEGI